MTPEEMVSEARRLYAESATVGTRSLAKTAAGAPLVDLVDLVPGLCDEVVRCLAGMRQLLDDRDRLRAELEGKRGILAELARYAADDGFSDAFVRGYAQQVTR